jgi:hypothetical protein
MGSVGGYRRGFEVKKSPGGESSGAVAKRIFHEGFFMLIENISLCTAFDNLAPKLYYLRRFFFHQRYYGRRVSSFPRRPFLFIMSLSEVEE